MSTIFSKLRYLYAFVEIHGTLNRFYFSASADEKKILRKIGHVRVPAGVLYVLPSRTGDNVLFFLQFNGNPPEIACRRDVLRFLRHAVLDIFDK